MIPRPPPTPPIDRAALLALARRVARDDDEAEDLLQDALVVAAEQGRWPPEPRWMRGVLRNLAAMHVRSAVRRRRREAMWEGTRERVPPRPLPVPDPRGLPPGLARLARLVGAGCTRDEVRWLLRLRDPALRQRLRALRQVAVPTERPPTPCADRDPVRSALLRHPGRSTGFLGATDPDGHGFFVGVLTRGGPSATG